MTDAPDARDFTVVMRGYERTEVDEHLRRARSAQEQLEGRVRDLEQQLSTARATPGPDGEAPEGRFEALGAETTRILVAAESSAREMREKAARQAELEVAAAERAARERVETASDHAARIIADAESRRDEVEAEIARLDEVRAGLVTALQSAVDATTGAVGDVERVPTTPVAPQPAVATAAPVTATPGDDVAAAAVDHPAAVTPPSEEASASFRRTAAAAAVGEVVDELDITDGEADEASDDPEGDDEPGASEEATADVEGSVPSGGSRGAIAAALADATGTAPAVPDDAEPTMRRERSLAVIRPGMLRRVRRRIQELQNGVLQRVRDRGEDDVETLLPDDGAHEDLAGAARVFLLEAYRAGRTDAAVLAGTDADDDATAPDEVAAAADAIGRELVAAVATTLTPSLRAGIDAGEADASLSERVGEVFRDLKGPVVEGAVDEHLTSVYGAATLDGWREAGIAGVRWVLGEETRCPEGLCRSNAAEGAVPLGQPFPSGHDRPPVHDGCTCALLPD